MILTVYTDGGAIGNPGPSASAYVIFKSDKILHQEAKYLGEGTNNNAEYVAVVLALEKIQKMAKNGQIKGVSNIDFISDSQLLVSQLNGLYKVKNGTIREHIMKIRILENELGVPIAYHHVYREENKLADSLVKKALNSKF